MARVTTFTQCELDPRPDLEVDHGYWVALLTSAKLKSQDVFGVLHGLRCGGAGLVRDRITGLRIVPGEWVAGRYNECKTKYLRPNVQTIKSLLAKASKTDVKNLTTKDDVVSRVKAVEQQLKTAGWSEQEIWADKNFDLGGRRRMSVCAFLLSDPYAEITNITSEYAEFINHYPSGYETRRKLYRIMPYEAKNKASAPEQPQLFATSKKEAV